MTEKRHWIRPLCAASLIFFVACTGAFSAKEAESSPITLTEPQIQAACLFNFLKFIYWPESALDGSDTPFVVGFLGKEPVSSIFEEIARGQNIEGRKLIVKRLTRLADLKDVHMLFIGQDQMDVFLTAFKQLEEKNILTISALKGFSEKGGIINFTLVKNKVRFKINLNTAKESQLKISSRLLQLGTVVGCEPDQSCEH